MNPKVEAFLETAKDWWLDLADVYRGLLVGLIAGFVLGALIF